MKLIALTAPGFHNLESDSVTLAQRTNDFVAMRVAARPDRFQGLAALPTSAPREAARELERGIRELGLKGAMLYGRTREKNLDHQDNWPTFEAAADLGILLFIHPQIQIILGHWGEVVLFHSERLAMLDRVAKLQQPFIHYTRQNLYLTASGMFNEAYLQRSIEIVGSDRILFSTDYPYQYRPGGDARRFLEGLNLNDADMRKFTHANWERLTQSQPKHLSHS